MFTKAVPAFALAVLALSGAMPAHAEPAQTRSAQVAYGDLDLRTAEGATELRHRIASAAAEVCGPLEAGSLTERGLVIACRAKAVADSAAKADALIAMAKANPRYAMNGSPSTIVR
jgi:UrcA family protein